MEPWDVTIVGGGVLGTSVAYWLANRYEGRIAVLEKEVDVAAHTSRRDTGVVHRPFYLDPVGRKVFPRGGAGGATFAPPPRRPRTLPTHNPPAAETPLRGRGRKPPPPPPAPHHRRGG